MKLLMRVDAGYQSSMSEGMIEVIIWLENTVELSIVCDCFAALNVPVALVL